jgi:hypothetical protein
MYVTGGECMKNISEAPVSTKRQAGYKTLASTRRNIRKGSEMINLPTGGYC